MREPPTDAANGLTREGEAKGGEDVEAPATENPVTDPVARATAFAPADPLDGRGQYEWRTRYSGWSPKIAIACEAMYLFMVFVLGIAILFVLWNGDAGVWLNLGDPVTADTFARAGYVFVGGLLGGTTLSVKWLYHSVAKGRWHQDRVLWRLFTPLLSAMFASAILALLTADLLGFLDQQTLRRSQALFGIAFVVGYFSDNAVAALATFADRVFGSSPRRTD